MKKIAIFIFLALLGFGSCIKKNETTSTEIENLQEDAKDLKNDVKELVNTPKDTLAEQIKDEVKKPDGFEGPKNREF